MEPFKIVSGLAAPMMTANIDTDVIMPKQFLKGIDRKGLDRGVFFDQRFLDDGSTNPEFVLNTAQYKGAKFLLTGPNFGCGSSREHAVWGLRQLGIQALIGTTFAGIFFDNCMRNGVLAATLKQDELDHLVSLVTKNPSVRISINLIEQVISLDGKIDIKFEIDQLRKNTLIEGLDPIGSTLQHRQAILDFEQKHLQDNPWLADR